MNTFHQSLGDEENTSNISESTYLEAFSSLRRRAHLIILNGESIGKLYLLHQDNVLGRGSIASLQLSDHGISREHCRIFSESNHFIIQDLNSHNGTFVNNNRVKSGILRDGDKIQIGLTTLKFAFLDEIEESYIEQMAKSAILDPLTEVYNRRYFLHQLEAEIHYSLRHHLCLSLLAIDLDHFKQINDQYGHLIGDQVLIQFAALIKDSIRTEDLLSRYGGDEFLLLVRGTNQSQAMNLAERLRQQVGRCVFRSPDHSFHLTISIGVATLPSTTSVFKPIELLAAADEALYQAKRSGRDCVCI